ncbi:MAG TPA: ABC transporter permease [Chitinophaga sp.]
MFSSLKILSNSMVMALQEMWAAKLRTFLSLLGVTIGIFCITAVLTVTASLEYNVRRDVASLGSDVIYVQKWPWGGGGEYPWWKYLNRPQPRYTELKNLQAKVSGAETIAFMFSAGGKKVEYGDAYVEQVEMDAVTQDFDRIQEMKINGGRYFSPTEIGSGANVVVMGGGLREALFATPEQAIGKIVRLEGRPCRIVGTLVKKGSSLVGGINFDNAVIVPYFFGRTIVDERQNSDPLFMAKARPGTSVAQLKDELRGTLRAGHRLKPRQEDDFALNEISTVSNQLNDIFSSINLGGWFIGAFALIVGGFGIANIMFVTVKERTKIIGLKKAIGAQQRTILSEFLLESVMLCIIGGTLGILVIWGITVLVNKLTTFELIMTLGNIVIGLTVSVVTGILSGFIPAYNASRLDAVVAIRSN